MRGLGEKTSRDFLPASLRFVEGELVVDEGEITEGDVGSDLSGAEDLDVEVLTESTEAAEP